MGQQTRCPSLKHQKYSLAGRSGGGVTTLPSVAFGEEREVGGGNGQGDSANSPEIAPSVPEGHSDKQTKMVLGIQEQSD